MLYYILVNWQKKDSRIIIVSRKDTSLGDARNYGLNIAKGKYLDKKKTEKWEYFSEKNGALILIENYENGKLDGKSIAYSSVNNIIVEETEYVDGLKNGAYNKYYDNGKIMVKANYKNDILDGEYVFYYPNGIVKEEGLFSDGQKVGEWKTYDMEEGLLSVDVYSDFE